MALLGALADKVEARVVSFVPVGPDGEAVSATPKIPVPDEDRAALDELAQQFLAGRHAESVHLQVAAGVADVTAVCSGQGELRGALIVAWADKRTRETSVGEQVRLSAALIASILDAGPDTAAQQGLIDWAATQAGGRVAFAVSLDRLGIVNDVFGDQAGDSILRALVGRLQEWAGPHGSIARTSGARYLVIRSDITDDAGATKAAAQLRDLIAEPVQLAGLAVSRSASIGVAVDSEGKVGTAALLSHAVISGAAARAAGGDQVCRYDDSVATARVDRLRLELELHDALHTGQLRVHYQPELDLRTGRVVAVEALLRWQHPILGLLGAENFVPDSEQTHVFAAVQRWVINETCRQLAQWRVGGFADDLVLRVNVAAPQIVSGDVAAVLVDALRRNDLAGELVCVELTERRMPADLSQLAEELDRWRASGVTVAIDDFGTGEGTLTHLLSLPIDVIKIDQTFVAGMASDPQAAVVVAAVITLAQALGLAVVAEGVDGPDAAAALVRMGCLRGQGNALGEPMAPGRIATLLKAQLHTAKRS